MTDAPTNDDLNQTDGSAEKDPQNWTTGDEPATAAQMSYIETMATEAGETAQTEGLTKSQASQLIEDMQQKTGRGQ